MKQIGFIFALFFITIRISLAQLANSPWPMVGHDYRLSNSASICGPNIPELKWNINLTEQYLGGMAIGADGTIYVNASSAFQNVNLADSLGYVHAIDSSGNIKWTYTIKDGYPGITSPAVGNNGILYIHVDGNDGNIAAIEKLYAIDTNGVKKWVYSPGSAVFTGTGSSPSIWDDGTIFWGSKGTVLFRMNADSSINDIYNSPQGNSISNTVPLSNNGRFYLESRVFLFNDDFLWSTVGWFNIFPDKDGSVYCINGQSDGDTLYVYNSSGTIKSILPLPWGNKSTLTAMSDSFLVFTKTLPGDSTSVYIMAKYGSLYSQCSKKWDSATDLNIVLDSSNVLYVLQSWWEPSRIYAFNSNGKEKWHLNLPLPVTASYQYPAHLILGQNKTIYITINDAFSSHGYVYALGESTSLPVELTSFTAVTNNKGILLTWQTATEVNNFGFDIERRTIGMRSSTITQSASWTKISFVAGDGTSNIAHSYSYTDSSVSSGAFAYRLKQINNDGTYKYSSEAEVILSVPKVFALQQNYPNPFNPTTTITFTLAQDGFTTLKIYDVLGREVAVLVNGEMKAEVENAVSFNASKFSSGVYFSKLESHGNAQIKKLVLMK